jgi:hypothetical protein
MAEESIRRSALFVDFDNVYSGLRKLDAKAADGFARNPGRLVTWLTQGSDQESLPRRFLMRLCYLNPREYGGFRPFFTSAGFRVIDCPSLTQQGKNSADIHLVIDALDTLAHQVRYDEFIVCSADADFTPLMVRLRAHDRRTVMIAAGAASRAYQAVCDEVIGPELLVDALVGGVSELGVQVHQLSTAAVPIALGTEECPATGAADRDVAAAVAAIRQAVGAATAPITGARAARAALTVVPGLKPHWAGCGGFGAFVHRHLSELRFVPNDSGGWVLDPARHTAVDLPEALQPEGVPAQVCRVTGAPNLNGDQYAVLFEELANELAENGFNLTATPRGVRDRSAHRNVSVARKAVTFVVQGLPSVNIDLRNGPFTARDLALGWRRCIGNLCASARMELGAEEEAEIDDWILGRVPNTPDSSN